MASAIAQYARNATESASLTVSLTNPTVSGNTLVIFLGSRNGEGLRTFSVSDNKGNTGSVTLGYDHLADFGGFGRAAVWWYIPNITGGSSHQVTIDLTSGGSVAYQADVVEVSGVTTTPFGAYSAAGGFNTASQCSTGALAQAENMILNWVCSDSAGHSYGGAWTTDFSGGTGLGLFPPQSSLAHQHVSSTSSVTTDMSFSGSANFLSMLVALKDASSGNRRRRIIMGAK